jgi:hypothetical protein
MCCKCGPLHLCYNTFYLYHKARVFVILVNYMRVNALAYPNIIEQVSSNKSNLLLKIQKQNTQTLQLFTAIIKVESVHKSI